MRQPCLHFWYIYPGFDHFIKRIINDYQHNSKDYYSYYKKTAQFSHLFKSINWTEIFPASIRPVRRALDFRPWDAGPHCCRRRHRHELGGAGDAADDRKRWLVIRNMYYYYYHNFIFMFGGRARRGADPLRVSTLSPADSFAAITVFVK